MRWTISKTTVFGTLNASGGTLLVATQGRRCPGGSIHPIPAGRRAAWSSRSGPHAVPYQHMNRAREEAKRTGDERESKKKDQDPRLLLLVVEKIQQSFFHAVVPSLKILNVV